ncbi:hypothetical protein TNCV_4490821 [Trichonephila clavipes]|nr:hypothetical protein TNCV_4490821 [Trichonephila clavipes]
MKKDRAKDKEVFGAWSCCGVSFPKRGKESFQSLKQFRLLHDGWQYHLFPPPQFRHGTGGQGNIIQHPAPVVSAATTRETFGPAYLTSTYFLCTRKAVGDNGHQTQTLWLDSDALTAMLPTAWA